jgi:hypothetical protein
MSRLLRLQRMRRDMIGPCPTEGVNRDEGLRQMAQGRGREQALVLEHVEAG